MSLQDLEAAFPRFGPQRHHGLHAIQIRLGMQQARVQKRFRLLAEGELSRQRPDDKGDQQQVHSVLHDAATAFRLERIIWHPYYPKGRNEQTTMISRRGSGNNRGRCQLPEDERAIGMAAIAERRATRSFLR